jgi:hypothetical protein
VTLRAVGRVLWVALCTLSLSALVAVALVAGVLALLSVVLLLVYLAERIAT